MHEATRRVLSVILQHVEGFQAGGNNILVGATNRKGDLDAALLSRFDTSIFYPLPDLDTRQAILKRRVFIQCRFVSLSPWLLSPFADSPLHISSVHTCNTLHIMCMCRQVCQAPRRGGFALPGLRGSWVF
jgi:hypothetical protein